MRWRGDALELLDQRLLPERTLYVTCRSAAGHVQRLLRKQTLVEQLERVAAPAHRLDRH